MPSQDVLADIAVVVLDNPVRDGDEIVSGEKIFSKLWMPPTDGPLLAGGGAFIIGYGMTGHIESHLNYGVFGSYNDALMYGKLVQQQELMQALGWNHKKLINISDDASFCDDNGINVRGIGANIGSDFPRAGCGHSGSLVVWKSRSSDEEDQFIGIYSGPAFCNSPLFPGMEQRALPIVLDLAAFVVKRETELLETSEP
jgi:hypothetical protein